MTVQTVHYTGELEEGNDLKRGVRVSDKHAP
jgi:hypothetical protein